MERATIFGRDPEKIKYDGVMAWKSGAHAVWRDLLPQHVDELQISN